MKSLRHSRLNSLIAVAVVGIISISPLCLLFADSKPDLRILCSNTSKVCEALARRYEQREGTSVDVVRVPTSEALARLISTRGHSEFDVWVGGPAEAHAQAENLGLLRRAPDVDTSGLPDAFHSQSWFGIYGGILSFCQSRTVTQSPQGLRSWQDLSSTSLPLIVPSPLTSGTAATFLNVQEERFASASQAIQFLRQVDAHTLTYVNSGTDPAHLVAIGRSPASITFDNYCRLEAQHGADVMVTYPLDGTGFEIGAASLPRRTHESEDAQKFLQWVVSDEGQALGAEVADQSPVSTRLPEHISRRLETLGISIFGDDPSAASLHRATLIRRWTKEVYLPSPTQDVPAPIGATSANHRVSDTESLPLADELSWSDLVPTAIRTLKISTLAGLGATILGIAIALPLYLRSRRTFIWILPAFLPALIPPAVIAQALIWMGTPPYSQATIIVALAINASPFAVLMLSFILSSFNHAEVQTAVAFGSPERNIFKKLLAPRIRAALIPAFALTTFMAASDVSATSTNASAEPYLPVLALNALNSGLDSSVPTHIALIYVGVASATTFVVLHSLTLTRYTARQITYPTPLKEYLPTLSASVIPFALISVIVSAGIIIVMLVGASNWFIHTASAELLGQTVRESLLILGIVPLSATIGFLIARHRWAFPRAINALFLTALLSAPIAGGILIHLVFQHPISIGDHTILPRLLGGGSIAGGMLTVVLTNLLLALPASYFLMSFSLLSVRQAMRIAEELGASTTRTTLTVVIPALAARLIGVFAALSGLLMCMSAPSAFVVPVGSAFPAVALLPLGIHGDHWSVLALGTLAASSALVMISLGIAFITSTTRHSGYVRKGL